MRIYSASTHWMLPSTPFESRLDTELIERSGLNKGVIMMALHANTFLQSYSVVVTSMTGLLCIDTW